ncbi:arginine--tRNA ligase [Megalodesulfovibrio gigas]|uniref:Arginine--tRNA ligase n=1 Tax=Megalodesulfovibrio gigas (strain ATCC 19364 / DSM 1382 / NCIMB 9332 / VKM B-1759) TaxID=1121448 RepID=T2GD91_MEGG1|nr:arginine--tRNA ligase [Megalodesulfovibrio gigas]AGW14071.1 putative arginyl-tRNA synthetase [Megalodesulfovibrio gigas DSM 1382 = ATCC 19364]
MRARLLLHRLLHEAVTAQGWPWPAKAQIEPPRDPAHGDLAANLAMLLAKEAGKPPRQIAEVLREHLLKDADEIQTVDIAGPGFLNVRFTPAFWQATVLEILDQADAYGAVLLGQGKKVQVEYVSANPTGPLHIGHGRGAALGDSLARLLRKAGYDVTTEYYLNDAGRQMRMLGQSVYRRAQQTADVDLPFLDEGYKGEYIKDIAADVLADHPGLLSMPEDEAVAICQQRAMHDILDGIKKDLQDFRCEHQIWFSEQSLVDDGAVERGLALLREAGHLFEDGGALWFRSTPFGDDKDRVLRKSDGSLTYFASDIAYHADKYARGFDLVVDIWGADHHGYVPRMHAAVQALGKPVSAIQILLVQLVALLRDGEPVAMSTRAGAFDTLSEVVAEVGPDAARFIFLSRKSDAKLDFDLEVVKRQSMDNPVFYVQYAHARVCSVLRKAEEDGRTDLLTAAVDLPALAPLDTPEDMTLLRKLEQFPDVIWTAAEGFSPHHVATWCQETAQALHRHYTQHTVLHAEDPAVALARLALLRATAQAIRNGLQVLGVHAPDRMPSAPAQ